MADKIFINLENAKILKENGRTKNTYKGTYHGSIEDLCFLLAVMATDSPEFKKAICLVADLINDTEQNVPTDISLVSISHRQN